MAKNLVVSSERVKEAAKNNECARKVLETLFPEAFEDDKIVCKIGSLFKRKSSPEGVYAVVELDRLVSIVNITKNYAWAKDRRLSPEQISNYEERKLTAGEFKRLSGMDNLDDFVFNVKCVAE